MGGGRRGLFTLGLANRTAPSTLSSGIGSRWETSLLREKCSQGIPEYVSRCDTPELDWSGGEDEEGGLRMFETASAFNASNIIELRLETERLASMVSSWCCIVTFNTNIGWSMFFYVLRR